MIASGSKHVLLSAVSLHYIIHFALCVGQKTKKDMKTCKFAILFLSPKIH